MNAEVCVLGGAGMLGHKMYQTLRREFPRVTCMIRGSASAPPLDRVELLQGESVISGVDTADFQVLLDVLERLRPQVIVSCVGIIKQKAEAQSHIPSITINSLLPHRLAEAAAHWDGRVIHFSTDCVFSGKRGNYSEEDLSDAEDLYGKTKFLGEVAAPNALTLRTSIIGRELKGRLSLLEWFLSNNHGKVRGFRRAIYSGVTTNHLSELVASIIRNHPTLTGLYQVASEPISKYDLLCLLREAYELDISVDANDEEFSDRSMIAGRLHRAIGYSCPSWPALIRQLVDDDTPYEKWLGVVKSDSRHAYEATRL